MRSASPQVRLQTRTVTLADGRAIHCRLRAGAGEPLVLLHGLLDSSEGWADFAAAQSRPCVALDLPGFGRSDLPTRPRLSAYAEDVAEALALLDIPTPFALVGHSLGGAVATAVAERLGDDVSALLLLAPAGFGRIALAEAVAAPGVRLVTKLAMPHALSHRLPMSLAYRAFVTNNRAPESGVLDRILASDGKLYAGALAAIRAVVVAGRSQRGFHRRRVGYQGPVTAMWGTQDRVVPAGHRSGVLTAFPHAEIKLWKQMGHHPQRERLLELLALVAETCAAAPHAQIIPLPAPPVPATIRPLAA